MLPKCTFSAIGFLGLCLVVCVSPETKLPTAFEDYPNEPCIIKLTIRRFRLISSWELLTNKPSSPANYTLWYTAMSKNENLTKVENCSDITESSCDMTDEWSDSKENYYIAIVIVHRGDATVCQCSDYILTENASLEPPEFEIVGFTDHIKVMMEFPPVTSKVILEKLMSTSFFIKEQTKDSFRVHKHKVKNVPGNVTYVLTDLLPKTNYCVSVYFNDEPVKESPLKCTVLQPGQESGLSESAKVGLVTGCLILMVCLSTVVMLKRIGYICLKDNFPNVLNFRNFLTWIFPEWPPSEAIDQLEVIPKNTKKRLWNYDYGDDSDSDEEVPKASVTGYTMHGLRGKPLPQTSDTSANPEEPPHEEDSGAEESDEVGAGAGAEPQRPTEVEAGPLEDPSGPYERRKSVPKDSFPEEDNSSMDEPGDNVIFNVNLNSVFLRVLHDDDASETIYLTEDTGLVDEGPHRTESDLQITGGDRTQLPHPSLSFQGLWTEDGSSEKTDTSDSDADAGDGYIMR